MISTNRAVTGMNSRFAPNQPVAAITAPTPTASESVNTLGSLKMSTAAARTIPTARPPRVWREFFTELISVGYMLTSCLLYTSDAADDLLCVDLGGRRIIK